MKTCKRKKSYPKWAKYRAVDKNGRVHIYDTCPAICEVWEEWLLDNMLDTRYVLIKTQNTPPKDWKKTLRRIED